MSNTWKLSNSIFSFYMDILYMVNMATKYYQPYTVVQRENDLRRSRGVKPLTYNQVAGGYYCSPVKEQRECFISQNVPSPTVAQWRQVYAWLKKNGWRTSQCAFYLSKCKQEGYTHVGGVRAVKKMWRQTFTLSKRAKPLRFSSLKKGVVVPTSTKEQRAWKIARRESSAYLKALGEVNSGVLPRPSIEIVRDINLALKLRIRILALRMIRSGKRVQLMNTLKAYYTPSGCGEMPLMAANEPDTSQTQQANDTIIQTHDVPVVASDVCTDMTPAQLSTNDVPSRIEKMTFRSVLIANLSWDSTKSSGDLLKEFMIPKDILLQEMTAPQFLPLWSHAYFRPEYIILEFKLNSSRFSVGQLQVSCYFDAKYDAKRNTRNNIFSRSQMLHTLIDAGSSNTAILRIPYKHFNPWYVVNTKLDGLDIHSVQLRVIAPYNTPDGQAKSSNIAVYATLENVSMIGLRDANYIRGESQMFPMMASLAMQYLNTKLADKNRDKPPVQLNAPVLEPRATGSLACGTNIVEPLQSLRLDARGQVPHPVINSFDFNVQNIAGNYSLLKTFDWSKDQGSSTLLFSIDAGPLTKLNTYSKIQVTENNISRDAYAIPACGVVASCFNVFSGSIKIRFDVVGSFAHTGAFMVCFVPGYCGDANPGFDVAKRSYNVTFDIHTERSFEYQVPFVADKPWWPVYRLDSSDENAIQCYGRVWVYVVNPLIPMDNIPPKVQVNVYIAAGRDMAFAIPVQSQLALPWYLALPRHPSDHTVVARDGYAPYYVGTWRYVLGGDRGGVLRYGPVSDHIAQFSNLQQGSKDGWYYYTSDDPNLTFQIKVGSSALTLTHDQLALVPIDVKDDYGAIYLAAVRLVDLQKIFVGKYTDKTDPDWSQIEWTPLDNDKAKYSTGNPVLSRTTFRKQVRSRSVSVSNNNDDVKVGVAQMDNRMSINTVEQSTGNLPASRAMLTYGETFNDLKDLLRRYEVAGVKTVNIGRNRQLYQNDMTFYVIPQGNALDVQSNLVQQVGRDGNRCVLLACARHMLGSVNLKFIYTDSRGTLWCQHKPDKSITYLDMRNSSKNLTDVTYLHGYASALTSTSVNSTMTVNIPYYNPNSLILLQAPDLSQTANVRRAMSLGEVTAGVLTSEPAIPYTAPLVVYQSIGDDFSPHNYVGWPVMVPQFIYNNYEVAEGVTEMNIVHKLDSDQLTTLTSVIERMANESISKIFGSVKDKIDSIQHIVFLVATALPSKSKFSWFTATLGILVELGLLRQQSRTDMLACIAGLFSKGAPEQTQNNIVPGGVTEAPEVDESEKWVRFATMAWQGLAMTLDVASSGKPPNLKTFAHRFMSAAKSQAVATRGFISFFKNIFEVFADFVTYLTHWWHPSLATLSHMKTNAVIVDKFIVEALGIQNEIAQNVPRTQNFANRLDCLVRVGDEIAILACNNPRMFPQPTWNILSSAMQKLKVEQLKLLKTGVTAVSRYTPFVVWFYGSPGIGKSEATTSLASVLINAMKITSEDPIFIKPASAAYFTNMTPEKQVIIFDDFESFTHSSKEHSDGAVLMHLKTSAPYNPPMAAVEDKPMLVAPKVVMVNANSGWPELAHISCKSALLRRRDLVFEVRLKEGAQVPNTYAGQEELDFSHLEYFARDRFSATGRQSGPYTFEKMREILVKTAQAYDVNEKRLLEMRIKKIISTREQAMDRPTTVKTTIQKALEKEVADINNDYHTLVAECGKTMFDKTFKPVRDLFGKMTGKYEQQNPEITFKKVIESMATEDEIWTDTENTKEVLRELAKDIPSTSTADVDIQALMDEVVFGETPKGEAQMPKATQKTKHCIEEERPLYIEGGVPADHDELQRLYLINWHVLHDTRTCHHSDPHMEKAWYENGKLVNGQWSITLDRCDGFCVSTQPWFHDAYSQKISIWTIANLARHAVGKTNTIWNKVPGVEPYACFVKRMYKAALNKLSSGMKFIFKVLKVVAIFIIPFLMTIGAIYGAIVGIKTVSKYYSSENQDPETQERVVGWKDCFYGEFVNTADQLVQEDRMFTENQRLYNEYLKASIDEMQRKQYLGEGQSAAYEPKIPPQNRPANLPKIAQVTTGQGQIGQARNILHLIKDCTVWLQVEGYHHLTKEFCTLKGRGFAIYDRNVLIPRHYLYEWESINHEAKLIIRSKGRPDVTINYDTITPSYFDHRELCLINIPQFAPRRSILQHFCDLERWSKPRGNQVRVVAIDEEYNCEILYSNSTMLPKFNLTSSDQVKLAELTNVIQYSSHGKGKCMQVLQDVGGYIIGFHVAGNKEYGFAEPIVKESFNFLTTTVTDFERQPELVVVDGMGEMAPPRLDLKTVVFVEGRVQPKYVRFETGKTMIEPSLIHDMAVPRTMPVPLKPCADNQYTNPLLLGCEKHGEPCYGFNAKILKQAAQRFEEYMIDMVKPIFSPVRVWSETEAINGLESTPGFGRLVMKTSEGFPYTSMRPKNAVGKDWLLRPHQDTAGKWQYTFHALLRQRLDNNFQLRQEGVVPQTIFLDCLKDERLPIEKAKTPGKARIFSVSPLDYLIQYRQFFADFTIAYVKASQVMHHSIGIAAETLDWTLLARNLQSKGEKILCGDYKNFGPAFSIDVHQYVSKAKLAWYASHDRSSTNAQHREILCREVENAWHLAGDCLYQLICGHPSGSPDTTEKNSMVNTIYIYYAWIVIWREIDPIMAQFHSMHHHMWFTTYGDDLIINISDEAAEHFNNVNLQAVFRSLGISYTDDSKSMDTIRPWCTLSEATFLKRSFIPHPVRRGVICGALDKKKLEDIPLWIRKTDDPVESTRMLAVQTLLLAHAWGLEYFNAFRDRLRSAWRAKNITTPLILATWHEVDDVYYGTALERSKLPSFGASVPLLPE